MIFLALVLTFIGTALGVTILLALLIPPDDPRLVRLRQLGVRHGPPATELTVVDRTARGGILIGQLAERLGRALADRRPDDQSYWRKLLVQAGYRQANAVFVFQGYRLLLAGLLPGIFLFVAPHLTGWSGGSRIAAVLALVAVGLFLPHWWLTQRIKSRAEEISDALPNALDLMVVCVEAGLGLDATIQRLAQERQFTKQALAEEFQIVSQETRTGRPRSEALLAMKDRVSLTELAPLIVVLVQAEKMGTSVGHSLRVHADSLRTKRRQRAEERAAKIPVKMVFPLVLLIFPATLFVLLGPSYIIIFKALAALNR
jgi:tight adherence protein C